MLLTLVFSPAPRRTECLALDVPEGCTAGQALDLSGWRLRHACLAQPGIGLAIWGRRVLASEVLADGDRLECCRPLLVDPKEARRLRFKGQGGRSAGLFSRRKAAT